ncbi:hypothetical protein VOI54_03765 [Tamlana sp. 2201CG12-4]|uniref:hypothetical protein n=1 Tax=Tamlana sp. 2201CG12-4 TaxID=3112582 RepID=UPI002DBA4375|nr:hypothetical protein [Tamlana sp. 2201CG12-4]MEC3906120.1 hypothetical protein [Tamlana sp. 2201CG12-4]
MKQLLTIFLATALIVSCSSNDDDSRTNDDHFNITRNGESYTSSNLAYASLEDYDCNNSNLELTSTWSATYIENSEFSFSLGIVLPSQQTTFVNGLDYSNSGVNDNGINAVCFNNYDFLPDYFESGKNLSLDLSANNFNEIESVTKISESQSLVTHAVKGNYQLTYTDGNGYNVFISGDYVLHVEAYK